MKWMTRLAIVAVFILGALPGAMLGMKIERDRYLRMQRNGPPVLIESALKQINIEVSLNGPQYDQMRGVLEKALPALVAAENERRAKTVGILESVRSSAFAFLSEDQKQRYNGLHDRIKQKFGPAIGTAAATAVAYFGSR